MRIAIFAGYFAPHIGGYCKNIHELAKRLVADGHNVEVITGNTEKAPGSETRDGVTITRLPMLFHLGGVAPILAPTFQLLKLLTRRRHDLVVTQSRIFMSSALGVLYASWNEIPLVHVERGGSHSVMGNNLLSWMTRVYDHTIGALMMTETDRCVGISEAASRFIRHMRPRSIPAVIHNGINVPVSPPRARKQDDIRISFVGRLVKAKGVQDLLLAFDKAYMQNKNLRLVIIGDGPYKRELEKLSSSLSSSLQVTFSGRVEPGDVVGLLADCDILVNPSYSEGMPTTVLEAASAGLAIAATDVGGTRELIKDGYNGILLKATDVQQLSDVLLRLAGDYKLRVELGLHAWETARRFNWADITNQWEEIIKNVGGKEPNHA